MTVTIGPLTAADAERCAELERVLFPGDDPWSARAFRDAVRAGHAYLAARAVREPGGGGGDGGDGGLVGYAGLATSGPDPGGEAEVHTLAVDPAHQGRGTGRALLRALLARAGRRTVFLEVRTDNAPAIALYRSEGFAVVGTRPGYYRPSGADAHTMRRDP